MPQPTLDTLRQIHTFCRPAWSRTERAFARAWIGSLPDAEQDGHGNWHVVRGARPSVLWSCHTDTVHRSEGRQRVKINGRGMMRASGRRASCLGADDGAGVWILLSMLDAGVPGRYVFHAAEEIGCVGSRGIAEDTPSWLSDITHAVAFDRGGTSDVITHQCNTRTASDAFAYALADQLNLAGAGLFYRPSDNGVYTDTREYAHLVPECTNVSVGYARAHSREETLDVAHLLALREALLELDTSTWPVARVAVREPDLWCGWEDLPAEDDSAAWIDDDMYLDPEVAEFMRAWYAHRDRF